MSTLQEEMSLLGVYNKVHQILMSGDLSTSNCMRGLSIVELFCQQNDDHYYVPERCNIDLNTLHQVALSGLSSCLNDTVVDRLQECDSILQEYSLLA